MTPDQLAQRLDRIARNLPREMETAQKRVGKTSVTIAQKWSSGTETAAQLAADDHPYATRHGSSSAASPLINKQSGTFFAGWYYDPLMRALVNRTPYGPDLQHGTPTMVGRDIIGAIRSALQPLAREEVRKAIKRSLVA